MNETPGQWWGGSGSAGLVLGRLRLCRAWVSQVLCSLLSTACYAHFLESLALVPLLMLSQHPQWPLRPETAGLQPSIPARPHRV